MASKARLKLNTKKIYAAGIIDSLTHKLTHSLTHSLACFFSLDGRAVQELLKLATLLYKATKLASSPVKDDVIPPPVKVPYSLTHSLAHSLTHSLTHSCLKQVQDVKMSRGLASDITNSGAKLFDLLSNEINDRFVSFL